MALKLDFTTITGLNCADSYARIEQINISKSGATALVRFYADPLTLPSFHSDVYEFSHDCEKENVFKQAYNFLKTLPAFENAIDC